MNSHPRPPVPPLFLSSSLLLQRAASRKEPAKKLQTNPVNEAKHREEEELKAILAKFQAEEREWDREMTAPHSKSAAQTFVPLPPAGTMPSSSHPLMHELSIAHRNMLGGSSASETELTELLAWAQGYIATGLDRPRKALATLESRSNQVVGVCCCVFVQTVQVCASVCALFP